MTGLGISPFALKKVIGVVKAYTTRVGGGPFPTEDLEEVGTTLQEVGAEWGTTTGRRRRCGWLDLVVMKYSTMINGYTALNLTKLDVLDGFEEIKIATGYKIDGAEISGFPGKSRILHLYNQKPNASGMLILSLADLDRLGQVEVQWTILPGWKSDISKIKQFDDLPENCRAYCKFIEDYLGVKIQYIGVGPEREETIRVF